MLVVEEPFNAAVPKLRDLGNTSAAQGHNRLVFTHDIDVVEPLGTGARIADVFKISERVALPVEVVGAVSRRCVFSDVVLSIWKMSPLCCRFLAMSAYCIRAARLREREWTVRLAGLRAMMSERLFRKFPASHPEVPQ